MLQPKLLLFQYIYIALKKLPDCCRGRSNVASEPAIEEVSPDEKMWFKDLPREEVYKPLGHLSIWKILEEEKTNSLNPDVHYVFLIYTNNWV